MSPKPSRSSSAGFCPCHVITGSTTSTLPRAAPPHEQGHGAAVARRLHPHHVDAGARAGGDTHAELAAARGAAQHGPRRARAREVPAEAARLGPDADAGHGTGAHRRQRCVERERAGAVNAGAAPPRSRAWAAARAARCPRCPPRPARSPRRRSCRRRWAARARGRPTGDAPEARALRPPPPGRASPPSVRHTRITGARVRGPSKRTRTRPRTHARPG